MKKTRLKIVSVFACAAMLLAGAAGALSPLSAVAETQTQTNVNGLILPQSYEEYLDLNAPVGVAVSESHTAIAAGKLVYVYDRASETYSAYEHTEKISRVQFDNYGTLYFSDDNATLYTLSFDTEKQATKQFTPCSTFLIEGDALYYTLVTDGTDISRIPLSELSTGKSDDLVPDLKDETQLAFYEGDIYFVRSYQLLYKISSDGEGTEKLIAAFPFSLKSILIKDNVFYCTTSDKEFYAYSMSDLFNQKDPEYIIKATGGYTALSAYGEFVYAVKNNSVKQYSTADKQFTDFEICSSSDAPNRLHGASETLLAGDKLYIADNGNARISVYDTAAEAFDKAIDCALSPSYLAADKKTLLAANKEKAVLYDLSSGTYGEPLLSIDGFDGELVGVTNVYGTYYLATNAANAYALAQNPESGQWSLSDPTGLKVSPSSIVSDVYGDVYLVYGKNAYRYKESELLDPSASGVKISFEIETNVEKLFIDYERNLYALAEGKLYKFAEQSDGSYQKTQIDLSTPYVYGVEGYAPKIVSLTFGIEKNATYLLCDGNYITVTDGLSLPTVSAIAVDEGVSESVFASESVERVEIVKTAVNALFVEFDVAALQTKTDVFEYVGYERSTEQKTALKIGESGKYNLIAVFDKTQKAYDTYLVLKTASPVSEESYQTTYAPEQQKTAYLTSDVELYKFPYLTALLTVETLPRGGQVTMLGEVNELDYDYYYVRYTDENGGTKTGYIPKVFATLFKGTPPETQTDVYGTTIASTDNIWRLAYLCLGFGAICILVDYLLLRKKPDGENDEQSRDEE